MNASQIALINAAKTHIDSRAQSNLFSAQALTIWKETLRIVMASIKQWINPLTSLDDIWIKEVEFAYPAGDNSNREAPQKGPGLILQFADTELSIRPIWFKVGGAPTAPLIAYGVVELFGHGMKEPVEIKYLNGTFEKIVNSSVDAPFGELTFGGCLVNAIGDLKPQTSAR